MLSKEEIIKSSKPSKNKIIGGVYFLIQNDKIVYVGQAHNLLSRFKAHKKSRFRFNRWFYIEIKDCEEREGMEKKYIKDLRPLYNFKDNPDYYLKKKN